MTKIHCIKLFYFYALRLITFIILLNYLNFYRKHFYHIYNSGGVQQIWFILLNFQLNIFGANSLVTLFFVCGRGARITEKYHHVTIWIRCKSKRRVDLSLVPRGRVVAVVGLIVHHQFIVDKVKRVGLCFERRSNHLPDCLRIQRGKIVDVLAAEMNQD